MGKKEHQAPAEHFPFLLPIPLALSAPAGDMHGEMCLKHNLKHLRWG